MLNKFCVSPLVKRYQLGVQTNPSSTYDQLPEVRVLESVYKSACLLSGVLTGGREMHQWTQRKQEIQGAFTYKI